MKFVPSFGPREAIESKRSVGTLGPPIRQAFKSRVIHIPDLPKIHHNPEGIHHEPTLHCDAERMRLGTSLFISSHSVCLWMYTYAYARQNIQHGQLRVAHTTSDVHEHYKDSAAFYFILITFSQFHPSRPINSTPNITKCPLPLNPCHMVWSLVLPQ